MEFPLRWCNHARPYRRSGDSVLERCAAIADGNFDSPGNIHAYSASRERRLDTIALAYPCHKYRNRHSHSGVACGCRGDFYFGSNGHTDRNAASNFHTVTNAGACSNRNANVDTYGHTSANCNRDADTYGRA